MNRDNLSEYKRLLARIGVSLIFDLKLWEPASLIIIWRDNSVSVMPNTIETADVLDSHLEAAGVLS